MVKLNLVMAKEYSKCRAKDLWIDSGSFGSFAFAGRLLMYAVIICHPLLTIDPRHVFKRVWVIARVVVVHELPELLHA